MLTSIVAVIAGLNTWVTYRPFLAAGVETQGRVIAKEPKNHQFIRYSYAVGQQTYTGLWSAGCGNPGFDALKPNDVVGVTYDSRDQRSSILGNARCWVRGNLPFIIVVSLVVPVFIMVGLIAKGVLPRL